MVADLVETHVDGFRALFFNGVVGKSDGGLVVNLHGHGGLGVAKLAEKCADGGGFLSIGIGGTYFSFGGRSHDVGHDFGNILNRSIEPRASAGGLCWIRLTVPEKIMATGAAVGTGCGKVRGVAVGV